MKRFFLNAYWRVTLNRYNEGVDVGFDRGRVRGVEVGKLIERNRIARTIEIEKDFALEVSADRPEMKELADAYIKGLEFAITNCPIERYCPGCQKPHYSVVQVGKNKNSFCYDCEKKEGLNG